MKPKAMKAGGDLYGYLGHMRHPKNLMRGHNDDTQGDTPLGGGDVGGNIGNTIKTIFGGGGGGGPVYHSGGGGWRPGMPELSGPPHYLQNTPSALRKSLHRAGANTETANRAIRKERRGLRVNTTDFPTAAAPAGTSPQPGVSYAGRTTGNIMDTISALNSFGMARDARLARRGITRKAAR